MGKKIEFQIGISDFDPEAAKRHKAARDEVAKIEKQIIDAFVSSDRFKSACDLAGVNDYGNKNSPMARIDRFKIVTTLYADLADDNPKVSPSPTLYLGEKTVNMLLSGKLLTDEQKKALLKQIGFDADNLIIPNA